MSQNQIIAIGIIFLSAVILGGILFHYLEKNIRSRRLRKRFKRGAQGEEKAKEFFRRNGYKILAEQVEQNTNMWINGEKTTYGVRADFLIKKGGRKALVEVKTGAKAINPAYPQTRRQIFEYAHLYNVDEVYLFNAENQTLKSICFDHCNRKNHSSFLPWTFGFVTGFIAAMAIAITVWERWYN